MTTMVDTLIPEYVKRFTCIGGACEDTCCSGWTVNIDQHTLKKYKKVKHTEFKTRLRENVVKNDKNPTENFAASMKLKQSRCSFLNEENLCDIQLNLGESFLCTTCSVYPRRTNKVNGKLEQALSVSCPEAARLVMLNEGGISFEQGQDQKDAFRWIATNIETRGGGVSDWRSFFEEYRYVTIAILQNRAYTLEERLLIIGLMFGELQESVDTGKAESIPDVLGNYLKCSEDGTFQGAFNEVAKRLDIQVRLCRELVVLGLKHTPGSTRYLECSRAMMAGLGMEDGAEDHQVQESYEKAYGTYYLPFIQEHGYMLENYLVNYVFKNCMPLDSTSLFESYARMIMHYSLIKIHMVGIAGHEQGLTSDSVIKLIQSISKTFEHSIEYFEKIMTLVKENGFMSMPYMSILIKN
ncbi:lysine-N-methylase [Paenibacillus mucilaginosus]|uniref:flagellin lysine-N-methylase n=1 Tax=Paenibacillus mucilaginosus TaxID=61624 RepID=UPI003D1D8044